ADMSLQQQSPERTNVSNLDQTSLGALPPSTQSDARMDPRTEYKSRLSEWTRRADTHDRSHQRMGSLRILFGIVLLVLTAALCRSHVALGFALTILILGLFLTGMLHVHIENARDKARRAVRFYQAGLERLDGSWAGKGSDGMDFFNPHHPYAADLD